MQAYRPTGCALASHPRLALLLAGKHLLLMRGRWERGAGAARTGFRLGHHLFDVLDCLIAVGKSGPGKQERKGAGNQ